MEKQVGLEVFEVRRNYGRRGTGTKEEVKTS